MKIGVDKTIITPPTGIALAGFDKENRTASVISDDLYISTMVLEHEGKKAAVICADIIGFGRETASMVKNDIYNACGLQNIEILLSASHTHSGPQTCDNMNPALGVLNTEYLPFFRKRILQSISNSFSNMEDVDIHTGKGQCNIGINRRKIVDGKAQLAPNEEGTADKDVMIVKFTKGDKVKAVLFNYACHPSTVGQNNVTADFPGRARMYLEEKLGKDVTALFLQGCCGDIRVRTIENGRFRPGTMEDVDVFGKLLGEVVAGVCNSEMEKVMPCLSTEMADFYLPLKGLPSLEDLKNLMLQGTRREKAWAKGLISKYDELMPEIPYRIQKLCLGENVCILGMEGEVCSAYGLKAKSISGNCFTITAGCCNRTPGYIPERKMLSEGGYEPAKSIYSYSLPSQFGEEVEDIICRSVNSIL